MSLYPMKFAPILKKVIWGGTEICKFKDIDSVEDEIGESWEISDVKGSVSVVSNGELKGKSLDEILAEHKGDLLGEKNYAHFGNKFPLLIKFIDAQKNLSIQVHPDDELAKKRHNSFGKAEMWYVIKAKEDAFLYSGFKKKCNPKEYVKSLEDDSFMDYLCKKNIAPGDVFFLPAGRVHAIGAGSFIAEIQQTSDITYRIYDYKRKDANGKERELHTDLAKDAIDYSVSERSHTEYIPQKDKSVLLESNKYFTTNLLDLENPLVRDYAMIDSFVIYICTKGGAVIEDDLGSKISVKQGESILMPAIIKSVKIRPQSAVKLLETYV